jgi:hypothetical protein
MPHLLMNQHLGAGMTMLDGIPKHEIVITSRALELTSSVVREIGHGTFIPGFSCVLVPWRACPRHARTATGYCSGVGDGEKIENILTLARGGGHRIEGIKIVTRNVFELIHNEQPEIYESAVGYF